MFDESTPQKKKRGFASLTPEQRRSLASKGGKAAHSKGTAHEFSTEEAKAAGSKGGKAATASGKANRFTQDEARAAALKHWRRKKAS